MAVKKQLKKTVPKINKNAKPSDIVPQTVSDESYRCSCCGHKYPKQEGNFNVSKSPIYKGNNGYMTICKRCIGQLFDQYVDFFDKDEDAAMERICQITDMYVDDTAWAASRKVSANRSRMSAYVSKLNLNQSTVGATYADTLLRRWEEEIKNAESIEQAARNGADEDAARRFGLGFSDSDYDAMQAEYDSWVQKEGKPIDKRQEELYVTMCFLRLNLQKSVQNGSAGVGTVANSYKSFIEAATTEIEDRKRLAEQEAEMKPVGMLFKTIEQYTPAEFYKDKKLYGDFDQLGEYIERHMVRPLRNLLTGTKELDKEFSLSGAEE